MIEADDLGELSRSGEYIFQFREERDAADDVLIEDEETPAVLNERTDLFRALLNASVNGFRSDDEEIELAERIERAHRLEWNAERFQCFDRGIRFESAEDGGGVVKRDFFIRLYRTECFRAVADAQFAVPFIEDFAVSGQPIDQTVFAGRGWQNEFQRQDLFCVDGEFADRERFAGRP